MRKKKRKKRRQKRKSGNYFGKFILFLLLLGVPVIAFYFLSQYESDVISSRAHKFMEYAEAGDLSGAASMMIRNNYEEEEFDELNELIGLLKNQHVTYERVRSSYLLGLMRGSAEVVFSRDGREYPVSMEMSRQDNKWMVWAVPPLKVLLGAFVIEENPVRLSVRYGGEEARFRLEKPLDLAYGDIVFVIVNDEDVLLGEKVEGQAVSRLMVRKGQQIETEKEGFFDLYAGGPSVYKTGPDLSKAEEGDISDLIVGREDAHFYIYEGKVLSVVLGEKYAPDTIRVVLNDSSYNNLHHGEVRLTSDTGFMMKDKDSGEEYSFPAWRIATIQPDEGGGLTVMHGGEDPVVFPRRVSFEPLEETGRIRLQSITRDGLGGQSPSYRGMIDVWAGEEGLVVVSEVPIEEYLYSVVPGEMPSGYGAESLKVQSVISRSYAYRGILNSRFHEYGAHLDDSVHSQVYNNNPENEDARRAVRETGGLVAMYDNEPVEAIFFSTSCGYTANSEDVWTDSRSGRFPGEKISYLQARSQIPGEAFYLADEDAFRDFIDTTFENAYDRNSPYFRWQIRMDRRDIEETVEHNLKERYQSRPDLVLTEEQGEFVSREIPETKPLGQLLDIRVTERGAGGNIMVLDIEGTKGTYRLISEYVIRFTIRPVQYRQGAYPVVLERGDGSTVPDFNVLPSAFARFDIIRDADGIIEQVLIKGGGFGHGVGLSQHGARRMVHEGYNFMDIISHYYPGTQLVNIKR